MQAFEFLRHRKRHYELTFATPEGRAVLKDLARFCRANESTLVVGNDQLTYALIGRREVWLRITEHLRLSPEQLTDLYYGPTEGTVK
ncbi:MAG: hypothetical protein AB7F22_07880 [Reyranella sp.]|uniref:Bbp19 family protein n=1 Tax=Reyranella sp. TaxID=1929291 RepID=UPI003D0E251D